MKDSQVDLCGEIGRGEDESFPLLAPEDIFEFACSGCGGCCRGREDIVLSGYDLYRICARLRLPPAVVIRGYCRHYIGRNSRLPVVRLQPLAAEHGNCPFLYRNRCSIHDAEPLVCALYPLGQQIGLDGTVAYFAQPVDCGGQIIRAKCRDHLARYGVAERESIDVRWAASGFQSGCGSWKLHWRPRSAKWPSSRSIRRCTFRWNGKNRIFRSWSRPSARWTLIWTRRLPGRFKNNKFVRFAENMANILGRKALIL